MNAARVRQLFAIHRWTGLLTGIVILFLSLTGTGLVFITEFDRAVNSDLLVSNNAGPVIPPERALEAVQRAYPDAKVASLQIPQESNGVYLATTNRLRNSGGEFNEIGIDPHTAQITGTRNHQKTLLFVLRQIHLRFFYFGWKGRVVVGVFGVLLLLSTITGVFIYGRFIRALPSWYSIRRDRGFQISTSDWHKLVGILSLAFNIVIAVTGAVLGLENLARYSPAVSQAIHPVPSQGSVPAPPKDLAGIVPVSAAISAAQQAIDGFKPITVNLPNAKRHYLIRGNIDGRIAMEGASEVGIDATSGEAYFVSDARKERPVTRAYYWMDPLHFGYWGGVFSQILYVFLGLSTGFLSITGFLIWNAKTRRRPRGATTVRMAA